MRILALSCMLLCLPSFTYNLLSGFPDARFAGEGVWNDSEGNEGAYETYLEFNSNLMSVAYRWEDGGLELHLGFLFRPDGLFDVVYDDVVAGEGYCEADECYYDVEIDGVLYSEGLKFLWNEGILLKSGQKDVGGSIAYWDEELYDLDAVPPGGPVPPGEPLPIPVPPGAADEGQDAGQDWGNDAGQDWGNDAGQDASQDAGQDWGHDAGQDASQDASQDWGHDAGQDASQDASQDWGHDAGQDASQDASQDWGHDAGQDASQDASQDWGHDAGQDASQDAGQDWGYDGNHRDHHRQEA